MQRHIHRTGRKLKNRYCRSFRLNKQNLILQVTYMTKDSNPRPWKTAKRTRTKHTRNKTRHVFIQVWFSVNWVCVILQCVIWVWNALVGIMIYFLNRMFITHLFIIFHWVRDGFFWNFIPRLYWELIKDTYFHISQAIFFCS